MTHSEPAILAWTRGNVRPVHWWDEQTVVERKGRICLSRCEIADGASEDGRVYTQLTSADDVLHIAWLTLAEITKILCALNGQDAVQYRERRGMGLVLDA